MKSPRTFATTVFLGVLLAFAPPLWADREERDGRDDRDGRNAPKPQKPPHRDEKHRDEKKEIRVLPAQPARPPEAVRVPNVAPVPGRPVESQRGPRPPVESSRPHGTTPENRAAIPHTPIRDWRSDAATPKHPPKPGYQLDSRHRHNHYYPPRGHVEVRLPHAHRHIVHHNTHYRYHDGVWYQPHHTGFMVVLPPVGIFVPILPPFYSVIRVNSSTTYYYAGGVYYNWYPEQRHYVVVEAPPENQVQVVPRTPDQLFIYPKAGQSEDQQARDRYECHDWANHQTGFDPTLPSGGVHEGQHASKRADYFRAMKACLEARHYSVQ